MCDLQLSVQFRVVSSNLRFQEPVPFPFIRKEKMAERRCIRNCLRISGYFPKEFGIWLLYLKNSVQSSG